MPLVALENLTKIFTGPRGESIGAVQNVNLTIEDRELLVIVGPSGSGKTTLLRLIAGLEQPTEGAIRIGDQIVTHLAPKERDVAMVFQNSALYPHMSVYENMAFGLKLRNFPKAEIHKRVSDTAELLELSSCLERKPETLSGGQRQRVALGRALVRQPKLFLLDEPLSNLDPPMRLQMRAELARLHTHVGATMLYVTHDQVEAMTLGQRVAVLHQGALQQVDSPLEVYSRPANRFVASFMGAPPMNFFTGSLVQRNDYVLRSSNPETHRPMNHESANPNGGIKLCRFSTSPGENRLGLVEEDTIIDLAEAGILNLQQILEDDNALPVLRQASTRTLPKLALSQVRVLPPLERQEVWAAGVTYLRSKKARMKESDFSATAYDRVYEAPRPELFFKALPEKVAATGEPVGIRRDSRWNVPEPELALVLNSRGKVVAYTIGNDMSSRDIEGENLLYLPQAKVYHRSCALGPWLLLGISEAQAREWAIRITISRNGQSVFQGETSVNQIKRTFEELAAFLFRSQEFPNGAVLLTGTGVVPPDTFTLQEADHIEIVITGIGTLSNQVLVV